MRFQALYFLFLVGTLSACVLKTNEANNRYFDHFPDWDAIMAEYAAAYPNVNKYVESDSSSTRKVVEIDWENELHLFKKADINRLNLIPKYRVDTLDGSLSGLITYRFTALDENASVRLAEYTFNSNGTWESAHFIKTTENPAFETEQELWFAHNLNYRIVSRQKVNMVFETKLVIEGHPVGSDREYLAMLNIEGEYFLRFYMYQNQQKDGKEQWYIKNGKERIELNTAPTVNDSTVLRFPIFKSELRYQTAEDTLKGYWYNFDKGPNYRIPFFAAPYMKSRFYGELSRDTLPDVEGKWKVSFAEPESQKVYNAIGLFEQKANAVYGTFATETGDYRHLEGFIGNRYNGGRMLYLYTLDGAHAFYFRGVIKGDSITNGLFVSGKHYKSNWKAWKSDSAQLRDPNQLTYIKPGYDGLEFTFPNLNGEPISLEDAKFDNKVVLVSVTGTWCPNCKDETEYLKQVYNKYRNEGLEVIALQFERSAEFEEAKSAVLKANKALPVPYTQLIAGSSREAEKKLPMLNHVMSFPTLIVLNRNHEVETIHTGFYGPGTGSYYTDFTNEMKERLERLLEE